MFAKFICFFLLLITSVHAGHHGWIHLELGAGNYGNTLRNSKPEGEYQVLFETLDELVARLGPHGTFLVNDFDRGYAEFACTQLKKYASIRGYDSIEIQTAVGDFMKMEMLAPLEPYHRKKYDSIHLKNPESTLYWQPDVARARLQRWANCSRSGIYLFILYINAFIPVSEQVNYCEPEIFYRHTKLWEPIPYLDPADGETYSRNIGRVFWIPPRQTF